MSAKVSIVIATYNSKKTLCRALDSVKNQSYQDWECVIVDGSSKDGTVETIKEYQNKDFRFQYISEPDNGIYDAFNKGWKIAKGEWILYLGSDDELTSEGLNTLIANSDGADIVYGNTLFRRAGVSKLRLQISSKPKMGGFCCHQSLIMKRDVILKLGGFDMQYKILADKDLICRAMKEKCKIRQTNVTVSIFCVGGASSPNTRRFKESFAINKKYRPLTISLFELAKSVLKNAILQVIEKTKWK